MGGGRSDKGGSCVEVMFIPQSLILDALEIATAETRLGSSKQICRLFLRALILVTQPGEPESPGSTRITHDRSGVLRWLLTPDSVLRIWNRHAGPSFQIRMELHGKRSMLQQRLSLVKVGCHARDRTVGIQQEHQR